MKLFQINKKNFYQRKKKANQGKLTLKIKFTKNIFIW